MSIAIRVGAIVGGVLFVVLTTMVVVLRVTQESAMKEHAQEQADQIDHLLLGSIRTAMGQGVTDVTPFIQSSSDVERVRELRVLATAAIDARHANEMDAAEREVVTTKTAVMTEEMFRGEPVIRAVDPVIATGDCIACHDASQGDVLATVSLRYSMAEHYAQIASERWLIIGMVLPTIVLTFLGVMLATRRSIVRPLADGIQALSVMATGDLTVRMVGTYTGDLRLLKDSINKVGSALEEALVKVTMAANATASASAEISSSTEQMAAGSIEQTTRAGEVSGAVDQMTQIILENARNAREVSETAAHARVTAEHGGRVVNDTVEGMKRIADVVNQGAATVRELGRSSDQIGEIISVIDEIADQTNLLALNAAIEAARAGDQGRGFAVVADEVRKLAERTTRATKEIAAMIKKIQTETAGAVTSMERGTTEVERGIGLADKAGASLKEIVQVIQQVTGMVSRIASQSGAQSRSSEEIARNVEAISKVTAETSQRTQQIAQAAEDLNRLMENLRGLIGGFTLGDVGGRDHELGAEDGSNAIAVREDGMLVAG